MAALIIAALKRKERDKEVKQKRRAEEAQLSQLEGFVEEINNRNQQAAQHAAINTGIDKTGISSVENEIYESHPEVEDPKNDQTQFAPEAPAAVVSPPLSDENRFMNTKPADDIIVETDYLFRQYEVRQFYQSSTVQISVAILITVNFVINAAEKQVQEQEADIVFEVFEILFTVIFSVELFINMYAYYWYPFWTSGWNIFDFIVVGVALSSILFDGLPGIATLRLLRAFRVFRLFKRLKSLRKILLALEAAIPGCSNAFLILVLVSSIYSILGVEFFGEIDPYYFATFFQSLFTMFQIMTGESWSEIARPIIDEYPQAAMFFITYILVANIVLVNVIIAALLEEMVGDEDSDEEEYVMTQPGSVLDPKAALKRAPSVRWNNLLDTIATQNNPPKLSGTPAPEPAASPVQTSKREPRTSLPPGTLGAALVKAMRASGHMKSENTTIGESLISALKAKGKLPGTNAGAASASSDAAVDVNAEILAKLSKLDGKVSGLFRYASRASDAK
ncbi:hypothetical protein CYMTET_16484 [Cymbomonas tetramitiformis]|uniref:Ion transport domain-containing protein n=1 Tax=Cymbomonas tetramitiformis TaxID=36881 RepID=A0AAE0L7Z2_9CHLO|nr:hypothetical protein CYMTET_16484 [Cymbomonas tetramitiformis]